MIQCVIVDDEPLAREGLLNYVKEIDFLNFVCFAANPVELNRVLENQNIDLIFLDIQMPLMTGIEFLKLTLNPPMVILTTAHPNFALQGYELNVLDYLLKPITFNRFFQAVSKAKKMKCLEAASSTKEQQEKDQDFFFIKCGSKYEKIIFDDILYAEAMQNYVHIYTQSRKYTTLLFLKNVEQSLPKEKFLRVHKSYIIALKKVKGIDGNELVIGDRKIPVSRALKKEVTEAVLKGKLW